MTPTPAPKFKVGDIVYKKFKILALTKTNREVLYRLVDPKFPDEVFSVFPESELIHADANAP